METSTHVSCFYIEGTHSLEVIAQWKTGPYPPQSNRIYHWYTLKKHTYQHVSQVWECGRFL